MYRSRRSKTALWTSLSDVVAGRVCDIKGVSFSFSRIYRPNQKMKFVKCITLQSIALNIKLRPTCMRSSKNAWLSKHAMLNCR